MVSWRERAAMAAEQAPSPAPLGDYGLPGHLAAAVRSLPGLPAPKVTRSELWAEVTADAVRLAVEGWAAKALALGWSEHDVFGIGQHSSNDFEGLAVWLAGRKVLALSEWKAATQCGAIFYREAFGRPNSPRPLSVLLWRFGRKG